MTPEQVELAYAEAKLWLGVPHRNKQESLRHGIDCVHYAKRIYQAAGMIPLDYKIPPYDPREGLHNPSSRMAEVIKNTFNVFEIPKAEIQDGDVVLFRSGDTSAHIGVYLRYKVWHALGGRCVTASDWILWKHKAETVYRLKE